MGAAVGGAVGGLAFGSAGGVIGGALVGALAGNLVGRALDNQERARLAQATQTAFTAETNVPTNYTVEPTTQVHERHAAAADSGRRQAGGAGDDAGRRQHLPADRTHRDQERPDHDRDHDLLQGRGLDRAEAGFGLMHAGRPASSTVGRACTGLRGSLCMRAGADERRGEPDTGALRRSISSRWRRPDDRPLRGRLRPGPGRLRHHLSRPRRQLGREVAIKEYLPLALAVRQDGIDRAAALDGGGRGLHLGPRALRRRGPHARQPAERAGASCGSSISSRPTAPPTSSCSSSRARRWKAA